MRNNKMAKIVIGTVMALLVAVVGWILAFSSSEAASTVNVRERITANEVKIEAIQKWQDKVDRKLDAIHADVRALGR